MKKLLSILALALCFVACQNEAVENVSNSDLVDVVLSVDAPELGITRADGDGKTGKNSALGAIDFMTDADWANYDLRYILEVYAADENGTGEPIYRERMVNCLDKYAPTTFALRLVPNRDYKFVVFADFVAEGNAELTEPAAKLAIRDLYYNTADLRNITSITTEPTWGAMNEVRDAYFITKNVRITTGLNETLTLTRPFAKLRVIATDLDYIAGYSAPGYVEVTYKNEPIYKSFNAVNGELNATEMTGDELTYGFEVNKNIPYTEGYDAYSTNQTLFADYLLAVEGEQTTVNFTMAVYEDATKARKIHEHDFNTQIPIQRNHLTTIIGDLLTTQANITIEIDDNFVDEFVRGWGDDNATKINVWNAGEMNADGDYTFVVEGENDFKVTVNGAAVKNGVLTAGDYVLAEDAEEGAELTFTVEALQANETTRALVDVKVIGGTMKVESIDSNYKVTLDLVLQFVENKDVRHAIYVYEGPIAFGKVLDTPTVEAAVEGNVITLTWNAVEGATSYTVSGVADMPVVTEETKYVITGEYETKYTFTVVAVSDDLTSQPYTIEVTTEAAPVVETYKLYFDNQANWSKVYAHIWANDGEDLGLESVDWPGRELTETETIDGVTYYVFQLPAEANGKTVNVVFNDGAGAQTADLSGVVEGDLFFDNYVEPVEPSDVKLYLNVGDEWPNDGAWFAAYFFGNGETWATLTLVEGETNVYETTIPNGFTNVIFCRMNPTSTATNWDNKWNQTEDLTLPTNGDNYFTITNPWATSNNGTWSVYTPAVVEPVEPVALATPVVEAEVEGNMVTLSWELIDGAANYTATLGDEELVVEGSAATFDEVAVGTYTATVVANPADTTVNTASEAGTVEVVVEEAAEEVEVLAELDTDAYYIFKQATEMKGGKWYAIVCENKAATGLTGNYGYLQVTEAATRANGISLPATCAFGFLTTDGGYTIQQFDGKYVYQSGTYNSFNVSADVPADGGVWSVSVDGTAFTITNNAVSKTIQYDSKYNSYGSYADITATIPTLYELVEVDNTPMILSVAPSALSFSADVESKTITISTYGVATLTANETADWVSTSVAENVVTVTVNANTGEDRETTLTISYGEDSKEVTIAQVAPYTGDSYTVKYDFTQIEGFSTWTSSYSEHTVEYNEATVCFEKANKQQSTITDMPVTKGNSVTLVAKNKATITAAAFECKQWTTKAQTITLYYSIDGGETYTSTNITSNEFAIKSTALPEGTNAVKIGFSSTSNQVGIASATITYK